LVPRSEDESAIDPEDEDEDNNLKDIVITPDIEAIADSYDERSNSSRSETSEEDEDKVT